MTFRARILAGLCAAVLAGLLGQTLAAVAWFSGNGNRSISGRVTDQGGAAAVGVCVEVYDVHFGNLDYTLQGPGEPYTGAVTAADGTYTLRRLMPHGYKVRFRECPSALHRVPNSDIYYRIPGESNGRPLYVEEWWNDAPAFATADEVVVPAATDVTGIDAVLTRL